MKAKINGETIPNIEKYLSNLRKGKEELILPKNFPFIGPKRFQHQLITFMYGILMDKVGLFLDMGTGKTISAIDIASYRMNNLQIEKALIVSPTTVLYNWEREISKFSDKTSQILYGPIDYRLNTLFNTNPNFFIVNYEILRVLWGELIEKGFQMVILDESTKVKNPFAKMTTATKLIATKSPYRLILSGQPIANTPLDLFSQFQILDGGETFGTNYYKFRNYFFYTIKMGGFSKWKLKKGSMDLISERMEKKSVRFLLEECITLPGKTYQVIEVEMTPQQKRLYEQVTNEVLTDIKKVCGINEEGNPKIKAEVAVTKLMKLAQVCSGFSYTTEETATLKNNPKIEALKEIVTNIAPSRKVVIWCKYKATMELVAQMLRKNNVGHVMYSGSLSPEEKDKSEQALQKDDDIRAMIGQIRSGIGPTFTAANYAVYVENEWYPEARDQSEKRIYRISQDRKVVIIDLVVKDSVEEKVLSALKKKQEVASIIMKDPISEFIKGGSE